MSRRSQKFSVYDFDEDDIEKHSRQILKKFYPTSPKKTATRDAPLDKYTFLTHFSKDKKDQDKKCGHDLIDIDPAIEVEKRCTSSSLDCLDNHNARCCLPKVNSYSSRGLKIGTSTSSNCRDDTDHNFPIERELIGITSDDHNDSIELNATLRSNSHFVDNEELSTEEVLVGGVNTGESDMEIALLPKYILNGDKKFLNPRLTFSGNHVKLEAGGSILSSGPFSCVWTISEIFSIESWWFERHLTAALLLHLKSKDTELGIIAEDSGIVKLNWKVTHPCWPKIEDKICALNDGYKYTWKTNAHVALKTEDVLLDKVSVCPTQGSNEFVEFSFPKGDLHAVFIGWSDFQLLQPRIFINDTIIDFYMKYLETKVRHEEAARFHFFNSFFFRKLADLDGDLSSEQEGRAAFLRVRKWTKKLDLFKKDYIFIPVNFSSHWSLIVICQPAEVVNFKDNEMENLCKVPCILHMDSIRGSHRGLEKLFKSYLLEEWKERHNNSVEDICRRFWDMPFISLELPQQDNLFDCGLFLLHYTELFIEEAPENFNPFKIQESSNFLRKQWFTPAEASSKRTHIRELIYRIAGDHTLDVCASDKSSPSDSAEVYECNIVGQFHSGIDTSTDNCMISHSDCTSDQKFDTKPVTAAPEILQCDGEPKMNNDEILDPRYHTRSPSDRYCHPTIWSTQSKSIMSPIEEREDSEEQKSATLYRDKEVMATESKLLPGIYVDRENIKKQGILQGTFGSEPCIMLETTVSEAQKSTVLYSDVKENNEIPSTSDEVAAFIVEDSEEVCEIQSDNECQSCANNQNEDASSDQQFNPIATSLPLYRDKEVLAIESKLLPGIYLDRENIKKQDILQGTFGSEPCIILKSIVSEAQKSAVLDLDVKEHNEISSTTSDEFAACVVEDSEEICEIQSDNERQSCANNRNENSSSDQQFNPIATSLPLEHIVNFGLSHSFDSDFEEQQLKTPETVDIGSSLRPGVTPVLSNQESNFIEIADFTEKIMGSPLHPEVTPVLSDQEIDFIEIADSTKRNTKDQQSAKRPRNMLVDEEEPLSKRLETIVID